MLNHEDVAKEILKHEKSIDYMVKNFSKTKEIYDLKLELVNDLSNNCKTIFKDQFLIEFQL
jgi:hypothetical protein